MRSLLLSALMAFAPIIGSAQTVLDLDPIQLQSQNLIVAFMPPPWAQTNSLKDHSELDRQRAEVGDGTAIDRIEFIPKGQSFDNWSELYAFSTQTNITNTLPALIQEQVGLYQGACENMAFETVVDQKDKSVFFLICTKYKGQNQGEMAVFNMSKSGGALIKSYYHKRSTPIDLAAFDTFPISNADMQIVLRLVNAVVTQPIN